MNKKDLIERGELDAVKRELQAIFSDIRSKTNPLSRVGEACGWLFEYGNRLDKVIADLPVAEKGKIKIKMRDKELAITTAQALVREGYIAQIAEAEGDHNGKITQYEVRAWKEDE